MNTTSRDATMGFFRKKPGKGTTTAPATPSAPHRPRASGAIDYGPGIIDALHADHARLGSIYAQLGQLAGEGKYAELHDALRQFKSAFQEHILTENVHFYAYLERTAASDPSAAHRIHEFRRSMNTIARRVSGFADAWQDSDFATPAAREQFVADHRKMGQLLEQRMDSEESTLFPLYRPD